MCSNVIFAKESTHLKIHKVKKKSLIPITLFLYGGVRKVFSYLAKIRRAHAEATLLRLDSRTAAAARLARDVRSGEGSTKKHGTEQSSNERQCANYKISTNNDFLRASPSLHPGVCFWWWGGGEAQEGGGKRKQCVRVIVQVQNIRESREQGGSCSTIAISIIILKNILFVAKKIFLETGTRIC